MMRRTLLHPPRRPRPGRSPLLRRCVAAIGLGIAAFAPAQSDAPPAPAPPTPTAAQPVPAARQADNVAIITLEGEITRTLAYSIIRRLERAEREGADAVVIEINTPGGEIFSVLDITNAIKNSPIDNTVAWINSTAWSGGAIVALACREIVIAKSVRFGDAAPIQMNAQREIVPIPEAERKKILTPLLSEVVDSARLNGYDERLVQGFLMLGVKLWLVENTRTGARHMVNAAEYVDLMGAPPPQDNPAKTDGAGGDTPKLIVDDASIEAMVSGSSSSRPSFTEENPADWRLVEYVSDGTTFLDLRSDEMQRYGLALETITTDEDLRAFFAATNMTRLDATWSETVVGFLSNFAVKGVLIVVFIIALFIEMAAPGIGIAGAVALGALALIAAPALLIGAASWWSVAAVLAGVALVLAEVFVIPGFGIAGVGGLVALLAGLIGMVAGEGALFPDSPQESRNLMYGLATLMLAFMTAGVGIWFASKRFGTLPVFNRLILTESVGDDDTPASLLQAMGPTAPDDTVAVGAMGVVVGALRPAGRAEFGGGLVDVVSEMGFVEEGERVRVISAGKFRVVVERAGGERA